MGLWVISYAVVFMVAAAHHLDYGAEHHYTYTSITDTLGMQNVTNVIRFKISDTNETHKGRRLHRLDLLSFTQHAAKGYYADNPLKWDLSKHFLFEMEDDGSVNFVHYHVEDEHEVITLKKVLVGTLAVKTQRSDGNKWSYSSRELDHGGELSHTYEGQRTSQGIILRRQHKSVDRVHRHHEKSVKPRSLVYRDSHPLCTLKNLAHHSIRVGTSCTGVQVQLQPSRLGDTTFQSLWIWITLPDLGDTTRNMKAPVSIAIQVIETLHFDSQGTVSVIFATDNITTYHEKGDVIRHKGVPLTEDDSVKIYSTGDFPVLSSTADTRVDLTLKRMQTPSKHEFIPRQSMVRDTIQVKKKPEEVLRLNQTEEIITKLMKCVQSFPLKTASNRTMCVHQLQKTIRKLAPNDLVKLGERHLNRTCDITDKLCVEEKNLMIDVISHVKSNISQQLLIRFILTAPVLREGEVQRCLLHCIAIKSPIEDLIFAVESLCFGPDDEHHGKSSMSPTQRRACLTLGALAKTLKDNGNVTEADRIVHKVEQWLTPHDEEHFQKTVRPRQRRSVGKSFTTEDSHVATKRILIHTLGNAGHVRSLSHITSYMQLGKANPSLRRAAAHALKHFNCNESATALLTSALYDDQDVVRKMAYNTFIEHPLGSSLTKEQENLVLGRNYTYPVVSRLRRGLIADILKKLSFRIELPPFKWMKVIGSDKIGASFGISMENYIELKLTPFEGHFELKVDDDAYAKANLGLIHKSFDIVHARACYKKTFHYDLNILKDFSFDKIQNLASAFDNMYHKIVDPIQAAVNTVERLIAAARDNVLGKLVKTMKDAILHLPQTIVAIGKSIVERYKEISQFEGYPLVNRIKQLIHRIMAFVGDIKDDILGFYHSIVDAVTVTFPFVKKEVLEGFHLIGKYWKFWENPMESFRGIEDALAKFKIAVAAFIEGKNRVMDACFFLKGRTPYWFHPINEIKSIAHDLWGVILMFKKEVKEEFSSIKAKVQSMLHIKVKDKPDDTHDSADQNLHMEMTDGLNQNTRKNFVHQIVVSVAKKLMNHTLDISTLAKPFMDAIHEFTDTFKAIKNAYSTLRNMIVKGKSFVQKIFGAKFHRKFPRALASACDNMCGCGTYGKISENNTKGLELLLDKKAAKKVRGSLIVNPMHGIVIKKSSSEVIVQPVRSDMVKYEFVIGGLEVNTKLDPDGQYLRAGHTIGKPKKRSGCPTPFIHVAMRKRKANITRDTQYKYMNPSRYLRGKSFLPKWKPECKEFYFHYIGQVADDDDMPDEPEEEHKQISRKKHIHAGRRRRREADDTALTEEKPTWKSKMSEKFKKMAGKFDMMKSFLKKTGVLQFILGPLAENVNKQTLNHVKELLIGSPLITQLNDVINELASAMRSEPLEFPDNMPLHRIRRQLIQDKIPAQGDRLSLIDKLLTEPLKACNRSFVDAVVPGYGHTCSMHKDCRGITCGVAFVEGFVRRLLKTVIRLDTCRNILHLDIEEKSFSITLQGQDKIKKSFVHDSWQNETEELVFYLTVDMQETVVLVDLTATICRKAYYSCNPDVYILHSLEVFNTSESGHCNDESEFDPIVDMINSFTLPDLLEQASDYHLDVHNVLILINEIRDAMVDALRNSTRDIDNIIENGFPDSTDICTEFEKPLGPYDLDIFDVSFRFMVGPVPLHLEFGAGASISFGLELGLCLMTLKANAGIIPKVGAHVWGALSIDIGFAYGGIRLDGYLLTTSFPIRAGLKFSKFPIATQFRMDLELVPLELRLKAFAKLRLIFVTVTVFDACIWRYKMETLKKNLFNIIHNKEDNSPPLISSVAQDQRRKRTSDHGGCEITQLEGRHPNDTAFMLEIEAEDEVSDVKVHYTIGTHNGGRDVIGFTEMSGSSLTVPTELVNGIPLYWTVKVENSNGGAAYTQCMLKTYDNTIPDGRIEASYPYTSHPNTISGTLFVFDDSPLIQKQFQGVGYTPGHFGIEVVPWNPLVLYASTVRNASNIRPSLRHFSIPRDGKLTVAPMKRVKVLRDDQCADECLRYGMKCISFDFEEHSETCDLHSVIQGPAANIRISGMFKNYERLGVGYNSFMKYALDLKHGSNYFLNAEITNTLGYKAYVTSSGTMVDYTPPKPGKVGNASSDFTVNDSCNAAVTQRCVDVTDIPNHRKIVDGDGSNTVFNGHEPLVDQKYTLINHYISGNWDGFHDKESGIYGYTWAVGTSICGTDVADFSDPHAHLASRKFWTNTGYARELHLADGSYYVTVQAINNVVHGGAMVTTVCHSQPLTVDTTPPIFKGITDLMFEEDFNMMAVYYNTSDDLSHISRIDFGLGKTKHDVEIRGYSSFDFIKRNDPFIVVQDLHMESGKPAWIRLRSVNNVGLFTTGHSDSAILIDSSPPFAGLVFDGDVMSVDLQYQAMQDKICANWKSFYDPESGISLYTWGVGTSPGKDDVVSFQKLSHRNKQACKTNLNLRHNATYFSTIKADNAALNPKSNTSVSDGVLVDTTPPTLGVLQDGPVKDVDMDYSSETAEIAATWSNFSDPESKIASYKIDVFINDATAQSFDVGTKENFHDYSLSFQHGDKIKMRLNAKNGAGLSTVVESNGFVIDLTPPIIKYVRDNPGNRQYQSDNAILNLAWRFIDDESGIKEYKYCIYETLQGSRKKVYPNDTDFEKLEVTSDDTNVDKQIIGSFTTGAMYSVSVTAINHADMPSSQESSGVIIDTTPPIINKVHIGQMKIPEDIDEKGHILQDDQHSLTVSWEAIDPESDIVNSYVSIGLSPNDSSVTKGFVEFGRSSVATIEHLNLEVSEAQNESIYYFVRVKVINGAGIEEISDPTKPINVLKANVPGKVFDGRVALEDEDFTHDRTSLAMSFVGFESQACNIIGYEWAIGYELLTYDVLPFTDYGIVMMNDTYGHAQIHVELYEGSTYYVTVRAKTGHGCREEYILSSSDGITLDTTPPDIQMIKFGNSLVKSKEIKSSLYQSKTDSLEFKWNAKDKSGISKSWWSVGSLPHLDDIHPRNATTDNHINPGLVTFRNGETFFLNTGSVDEAGNEQIVSSPPITVDTSLPIAHEFTCTPYISVRKSLVECHWSKIEEYESSLRTLSIGVGLTQTGTEISDFYSLDYYRRSWIRDLQTKINFENTTAVYILLKVVNGANLTRIIPKEVVVDSTVPTGGKVEIVTTLNLQKPFQKQFCQIPKTYIEFLVNGLEDPESSIDRYEAAIGHNGKMTNLKEFIPVNISESVLITDLNMNEGMLVKVTIRVYNGAGLYTYVTSDAVVVSYSPSLSVIDGKGTTDEDYQNSLSVLQGHWKFSDLCPITYSEWWVEDITGSRIGNISELPYRSSNFYSDLMELSNEMTYINVVRAIDALNRTFIERSNGMTVKIQPPQPGDVRDGDSDDINYQESIHKLTANWDTFGNPNTKDPTQKIVYYEVAVGNDRRYVKTRTNVHYFVNVGLNRSYTFSGLNLTQKSVKYYITVRAYSAAGSFEEGYSNGIKVGYREEITPGTVNVNPVQSNTNQLTVSWSDFEADMGINAYYIGVQSHIPPNVPNVTLNCDVYMDEVERLDIVPLRKVGKNSFTVLANLTLTRGARYFVLVMAADVTGMCIGSVSRSIMIDTTPPVKGIIHIKGTIGENVAYVNDDSQLTVSWSSFADPESAVLLFRVDLFAGVTCYDSGINVSTAYDLYSTVDISNDNTTTFYNLKIDKFSTYLVLLTAWNGANLKTSVRSPPIRLDTTPPLAGAVRVGSKWEKQLTFQRYKDKMLGLVAVTDSPTVYECPRQKSIIPSHNVSSTINSLDKSFSEICVSIGNDEIFVDIRHDASLTKILKGGIKLSDDKLMEGNYSFTITAAAGKEIVTSIFLGSNLKAALNEIQFIPPANVSANEYEEWIAQTVNQTAASTTKSYNPTNSTDDFNFTTEVEAFTTPSFYSNSTSNATFNDIYNNTTSSFDPNSTSKATTDGIYNSTTVESVEVSTLPNLLTQFSTYDAQMTTVATSSNGGAVDTEDRAKSESRLDYEDMYGVGIHIPGFKFDGKWYAFLWMKDKMKTSTKQIELNHDPTDSENNIIISLSKTKTDLSTTWNVEFLINGQSKSQSTGLGFSDKGIVSIYTWNRNDYFPPVTDPFHPFLGRAVLKTMKVPLNIDKPCKHGKPFYDKESHIKEIWVGVSDTPNKTGTVSAMKLHETICIPCAVGCNIGCNANCSSNVADFRYVDIAVYNLSLVQSKVDDDKITYKNKSEKLFDVKTYYMNVEAVNMAGLRKMVISDGIMIDETPPKFQYVRCLDPSNSMDEPSLYQGTNSSMGAYWECDEDVGDIVRYSISIGTQPGLDDIFASESVGREKKARIDNLGSKLEHEKTYFFSVGALNSAGLLTLETCNITVEIYPPVVSDIKVSHIFNDHDSSVTNTGKDVGIKWTGAKDDVDSYEWQIGSIKGGDDIFPRVRVGVSSSSEVQLLHGMLAVDNIPLNTSVGQLAKKNWTKEEAEKAKHNTFFNLEPGVCIYVKLFAVGRSHLSSSIDADPVCVKRSSDRIVNLEHKPHIKKRKHGISGHDTKVELRDDHTSNSVTLSINGVDTNVTAGVLNQTDLHSDYGSAASSTYRRYIVDASNLMNQTTRLLTRRLKRAVGLNFYISPSNVGGIHGMAAVINFSVSAAGIDPNSEDLALVFYDKDKQVLSHVAERCSSVSTGHADYGHIDYGHHTYSVQLCPQLFESLHPSASNVTSTSIPQPRMFSLMVVKSNVSNTSPAIDTDILETLEDTPNTTTLLYHDAENDNVIFLVEKPPQNVNVNISDKIILLDPVANFNGRDQMVLKAVETGLSYPFVPHSVKRPVYINVLPQNDAPTSTFVAGHDAKDVVMDTKYGTMEVHVTFEGNTTKTYTLGSVVGIDIDGDNLDTLISYNNTPLANFTYDKSKEKSTENSVNLRFSVDSHYHGDSALAVRFKDPSHKFSNLTNVMVHILMNPCVHGKCENKTETQCNESVRSQSFSMFRCTCDIGYEGQWCQIETDECQAHDCSVFFDCEDLVGEFKCNLNIPKTLGLTVSIGVVVGIIFYLVRRKLKRNNKIQDVFDWDKETFMPNVPPVDNKRTLTAREVNMRFNQNDSFIDEPHHSEPEDAEVDKGKSEGNIDNDTRKDDNQPSELVTASLPKMRIGDDESLDDALADVALYSKLVGTYRPPHYMKTRGNRRTTTPDNKWAAKRSDAL